MSKISYINQILINDLQAQAARSPRRRKNFNFHDSLTHPCQRLVNVILPDAYVSPHRHLNPVKEEMLVILRGRLGLIFFDDTGRVTETALLEERGDCLAVNIPTGVYHTAVAFDEAATVFEAKAGPFAPHATDERASFAPAEESPDAPQYLRQLKALFDRQPR